MTPHAADEPFAKPVEAAVQPAEPKQLGDFFVTFYFVIGEDEVGRAKSKPVAATRKRDGDERREVELAATAANRQVKLFEPPPRGTSVGARGCKEISRVSPEFAFQLTVQGSGKLRDGRLLSVSGRCACERSPCFNVTKNPWGTSGRSHPLQPFRTVAVDPKVVRLGSLLYLPVLEGRLMPGRPPWGGYVHDGCVLADDTGGNIDGQQLDLFVGRKAYMQALAHPGSSHAWARSVAVYDGSAVCERKGRRIGRKISAI